jgi:threonine/homoserine/homoserine lactone efflux protein
VAKDRPALTTSFASTFLLTLSNPATILSFVAIFGTISAQRQGPSSPVWMVAGVLVGSAMWWMLLCAVVARLRYRFEQKARRWVARLSALMLAGFALWQWMQIGVDSRD